MKAHSILFPHDSSIKGCFALLYSTMSEKDLVNYISNLVSIQFVGPKEETYDLAGKLLGSSGVLGQGFVIYQFVNIW